MLAVFGLVALCVAAAGDARVEVTKVTVSMTDYAFKLSRSKVRRGPVVFVVTNNGAVVHDFKIAGKKTPIYEAGEGGTLTVTFKKAGRYRYVCTIPGHLDAGMAGTLRVTAP